MPSTHGNTFRCPTCSTERPRSTAVHVEMVRGPVLERLLRSASGEKPEGLVCQSCLHAARADYVAEALEREKGEVSELEAEVVRSLREHEILTRDVNAQFEQELTLGERVADRVATFGGSWTFLILFGGFLAGWIAVNTAALVRAHFDPFPYILLNLILSCIAAVQAPVIMMSQNRQEAKDRLRSEHDYRVNLKAELEIRHLNSKFDELLSRQWQRLLEIQRIQLDLMQ